MDQATPSQAVRNIEVVVTERPEDAAGTMGAISRPAELVVKALPVDVLRENVAELVASLQEVFARHEAASPGSPLRLTEVQVGVAVSATGGLRIIGALEVAAQGTITLTFGTGAAA